MRCPLRWLVGLMCDNSQNYLSDAILTWVESKGVQLRQSAPYTPQQNGKAESAVKAIKTKIRTMLAAAGVDETLWPEAAYTAALLHNLSPAANSDKTPWELFFGQRPDVSHLRTFGAPAYVLIPADLRGPKGFQPTAAKGVLLGYAMDSNAYRVLLNDGKIVVSTSVVFDETPVTARSPQKGGTGPTVAEQLKQLLSTDNNTPAQATQQPVQQAPPAMPPATPLTNAEVLRIASLNRRRECAVAGGLPLPAVAGNVITVPPTDNVAPGGQQAAGVINAINAAGNGNSNGNAAATGAAPAVPSPITNSAADPVSAEVQGGAGAGAGRQSTRSSSSESFDSAHSGGHSRNSSRPPSDSDSGNESAPPARSRPSRAVRVPGYLSAYDLSDSGGARAHAAHAGAG